jgi:hypothetical protein
VANKKKSYQVQSVLHLMVATEIYASSLEEALEMSKTMKEDSFVNIVGEYMDGNHAITGIYETLVDVDN